MIDRSTGRGRDRDLERRFLDDLARSAPASSDFARLITEQLDAADARFAGSFQQRSVAELLREALAEYRDGPAWALLAVTQAERAGLDARHRARLWADVLAAAAAAAEAHSRLDRALALLTSTTEAGS